MVVPLLWPLEPCRPVSEHCTSEGMVRYMWCNTGGWLISRSDVELIRVGEELGESQSVNGA